MTMTVQERGKQWVEEVLTLMGLPAEVEALEEEQAESLWLRIAEGNFTPEQQQIMVGSGGSSLDAIQFLANTLLNIHAAPEEQHSYTIEFAGYRQRRQQELRDLADAALDYVRSMGQEYIFEPMSSAERRYVHTILSVHEDIQTESRGREPERRLVVQAKGAEVSEAPLE
jgi:spoIIIJ-associated protein